MSDEVVPGGFIEYKCRRCGGLNRSIHTPNVSASMAELVVYGRTKSFPGVPCTMMDLHSCPDGGLGYADLIGAVRDQPEETE